MNVNPASSYDSSSHSTKNNKSDKNKPQQDQDAALDFQKQLTVQQQQQKSQNQTDQDKKDQSQTDEEKQQTQKETFSPFLTSQNQSKTQLFQQDSTSSTKQQPLQGQKNQKSSVEEGQKEPSLLSPFDLLKKDTLTKQSTTTTSSLNQHTKTENNKSSSKSSTEKKTDQTQNTLNDSISRSVNKTGEKKEQDTSDKQQQNTNNQQNIIEITKQIQIQSPNSEVTVQRVEAKDLSSLVEKMYVYVDPSGSTETTLVLKSLDGTLTTLKILQENNQLNIQLNSTDPQLVNQILAKSSEIASAIYEKMPIDKNGRKTISKVSLNCQHTQTQTKQPANDSISYGDRFNNGFGDNQSL